MQQVSEVQTLSQKFCVIVNNGREKEKKQQLNDLVLAVLVQDYIGA